MSIIKRTKAIWLSFGLAAIMLFSSTGAVFADEVTGSGTVTGGALTMSAADAPTVSLTLDGTDQAPTDTFDIDVNDATGSGSGWHLSVSATQFTANDASGRTLPATAAKITAVSSGCDQGTCTDPSNTASYPLTLSGSAASVFNAAVDSGMGDFTVTPTLEVSVPANTFAKTYESTITITVDSGP